MPPTSWAKMASALFGTEGFLAIDGVLLLVGCGVEGAWGAGFLAIDGVLLLVDCGVEGAWGAGFLASEAVAVGGLADTLPFLPAVSEPGLRVT